MYAEVRPRALQTRRRCSSLLVSTSSHSSLQPGVASHNGVSFRQEGDMVESWKSEHEQPCFVALRLIAAWPMSSGNGENRVRTLLGLNIVTLYSSLSKSRKPSPKMRLSRMNRADRARLSECAGWQHDSKIIKSYTRYTIRYESAPPRLFSSR